MSTVRVSYLVFQGGRPEGRFICPERACCETGFFPGGTSAIVARHKVPGKEFGHFPRAWGWVGSGQVFGPTGHESLAQGLPWETPPNVRSPEGATGISGYVPRRLVSVGAPSGPQALNQKPRVNPGLSFSGPSGLENRAQYLTNHALPVVP